MDEPKDSTLTGEFRTRYRKIFERQLLTPTLRNKEGSLVYDNLVAKTHLTIPHSTKKQPQAISLVAEDNKTAVPKGPPWNFQAASFLPEHGASV